MPSPFPSSTSSPGHGTIHLTLLPPSRPTFSTLSYTYPLKLLPSTPHILHHAAVPEESHAHSLDNSTKSNAIKPQNSNLEDFHRAPTEQDIQQPSLVPLLFMLTYGGGLVAGDHIHLKISLDPSTRLTITTQGSTKVFRPATLTDNASPAIHLSNSISKNKVSPPPSQIPPTTYQSLQVQIAPHSALWLAPDPVQPYADSLYTQKQIFEVSACGSVGIVDWVTEGRKARGESWEFTFWKGRNEIWELRGAVPGKSRDGEATKRVLLLRDSVILSGPSIAARMDSMGVFGTVILYGPHFQRLGRFFVDEFKALPRIGGRNWGDDASDGVVEGSTARERWRMERNKQESADLILWTACNLRGCTVVKFSAKDLEGAKNWLGSMLVEEGSIARDFGPGGLMLVR